MYENLALLTIFILVYSSVAGVIERSWISGPIVFTCFGLLIGAEGFDLLSWHTDNETMRNLAEVTLAVVLFTDVASANMRVLKKTSMLPVRLLFKRTIKKYAAIIKTTKCFWNIAITRNNIESQLAFRDKD